MTCHLKLCVFRLIAKVEFSLWTHSRCVLGACRRLRVWTVFCLMLVSKPKLFVTKKKDLLIRTHMTGVLFRFNGEIVQQVSIKAHLWNYPQWKITAVREKESQQNRERETERQTDGLKDWGRDVQMGRSNQEDREYGRGGERERVQAKQKREIPLWMPNLYFKSHTATELYSALCKGGLKQWSP